MPNDTSQSPNTNLHKYLRREKIFNFILVGFTPLAILIGIFISGNVNKDFLWTYIALGLMMWNYCFQSLRNTERLLSMIQTENATALFESIEKNYEMLGLAWNDYDVREAERVKAKWSAIVETAQIMKDHNLISKQIYNQIVKDKISYETKETKIRLENMKND